MDRAVDAARERDDARERVAARVDENTRLTAATRKATDSAEECKTKAERRVGSG